MIKFCNLVVCLAVMVFCMVTAQAQITPIGHFTGDISDDFGDLAGGSAHPQTVTIFSGNCTASNIHPDGFLAILSNSTRGQTNGDTVIARSFPVMFGQLGITQWDFDTPISQFGAYFENNSRFDDVIVDFYDVNDNFIGTQTAYTATDDQFWTWNGWESEIPIGRIVTTGNDTAFWGGFVWFDDAEITFATVPSTVTVDSYDVSQGTYVAGTVADLNASDNSDLSGRRSSSDVSSRVFLEVSGISPTDAPSVFEFTLESSVFARSNVNQSIDLFNYETGSWVEIDTRTATRFDDSIVTVSPSGNLSRFVEVGTLTIKARCRYQSVIPRHQFTANIDHIEWAVGE